MRYKYKIVPIELIKEIAAFSVEDDSYVAMSVQREKLDALFLEGYRWIRTDCDEAILEMKIE